MIMNMYHIGFSIYFKECNVTVTRFIRNTQLFRELLKSIWRAQCKSYAASFHKLAFCYLPSVKSKQPKTKCNVLGLHNPQSHILFSVIIIRYLAKCKVNKIFPKHVLIRLIGPENQKIR